MFNQVRETSRRPRSVYNGQRFSQIIRACGLTQTDVTQILDVVPSTVSKWSRDGLPLVKKDLLFMALSTKRHVPFALRHKLQKIFPLYAVGEQEPVFFASIDNVSSINTLNDGVTVFYTLAIKGPRHTAPLEILSLKFHFDDPRNVEFKRAWTNRRSLSSIDFTKD